MAIDRADAWQPDWTVTPGEILVETLEARGMSQSELARRMGRPIKTINEIVNGKAAITPETAIQLERALGVRARFWTSLETRHREFLARRQARAELEHQTSWLDRFPVRDLVYLGLIRRSVDKSDALGDLLVFFGVSSPDAWARQWARPQAALRSSRAFASSPYAVAAWLRLGEIAAEKIRCAPYDPVRFRAALREIRSLTRQEPISGVVDRLRSLCAEAGVAVVMIPELDGTRVSGAARWLRPSKAVIQLSLRHKSDDHFWFSFFHEAGHLLTSRGRREFVDDPETIEGRQGQLAEEDAANEFARDQLVPAEEYAEFVERADFAALSVRNFASDIGIAPGIVVGRLQRDGLVEPSRLNRLKRPYRWADRPPTLARR
jgi:addiction module HigA family antidote